MLYVSCPVCSDNYLNWGLCLLAYYAILDETTDICNLAPLFSVFIREKNQENGMWSKFAGKKKTGWFHLFESYCAHRMTVKKFAYFGKELTDFNLCFPN